LLPAEVLVGLRQRLDYGNEQVDLGEYAKAQRIFRETLDQIGRLDEHYPGTQALRSVKQEVEQAATRALSSCSAENEIIRKRNRKALPCE
jgi:hypothetical protein